MWTKGSVVLLQVSNPNHWILSLNSFSAKNTLTIRSTTKDTEYANVLTNCSNECKEQSIVIVLLRKYKLEFEESSQELEHVKCFEILSKEKQQSNCNPSQDEGVDIVIFSLFVKLESEILRLFVFRVVPELCLQSVRYEKYFKSKLKMKLRDEYKVSHEVESIEN